MICACLVTSFICCEVLVITVTRCDILQILGEQFELVNYKVTVLSKKKKVFMTKQNVSVLWTQTLSIQVVPVNSMRYMSLKKVNLDYTSEDTLLSEHPPFK